MDLSLGHELHKPLKQGGKMVCKLHESISGIKQVSRQWNSKFTRAIIQYDFTQSKADYFLFTKGYDDSFVTLLVYMDDIVITGPNIQTITSLKLFLYSQFKLI